MALDDALAGLEIVAGRPPTPPVAGLLPRRRHSVRLLRRAMRDHGIQPKPANPPRGGRWHFDLLSLVAVEDHLGATLDDLQAVLTPHHPLRPVIERLRAEADETARALRLLTPPKSKDH